MANRRSGLVVAGGTGGHILPGIALLKELQQRGVRMWMLSIERSRDWLDPRDSDLPLHFYNAPPFPRSLSMLPLFPLSLSKAVFEAYRLLRRLPIDFVVGMGGYSMFPALVAASFHRIPLFLCEQNAVAGRATRLMARWARTLFLNYPLVEEISAVESLVTGNPIRDEIVRAARLAEQTQGGSEGSGNGSSEGSGKGSRLTVLVLGGSQGALQINRMVLPAIKGSLMELRWIIQCGQVHLQEMQRELPPQRYPHVRLIGYSSAISDLYQEADIVVCRAGAGALSEAVLFGLPLMLIPYPYAADDHQLANAQHLAKRGAALLLEQRDSDPARFISALESLVRDSAYRNSMGQAARRQSLPDAAARVATALLARLDPCKV